MLLPPVLDLPVITHFHFLFPDVPAAPPWADSDDGRKKAQPENKPGSARPACYYVVMGSVVDGWMDGLVHVSPFQALRQRFLDV